MGITIDNPSLTFRFADFELDLAGGQLRRRGVKVKLQEQPLQALIILVKSQGQIVTREQLRSALWPSETFVDFDHSLNSAVMRLREALGDSAERPIFIETVPKRGYRFSAPITSVDRITTPAPSGLGDQAQTAPSTASPVLPSPRQTPQWFVMQFSRLTLIITVSGLLVVAIITGLYLWRIHSSVNTQPIQSLVVLPIENLVGGPAAEPEEDDRAGRPAPRGP